MMGGFHMGVGWFWLILITAIVVVGFFMWQISNSSSAGSHQYREKLKGHSKSAREIADERYANGEISRDEYNTIIDDLERDHAAG